MPVALTSTISPLAAALETLIPALEPLASAFSLLAQSVQNTINRMEGWANALSPATIFSFEYALRNLQATLGQAVVPMFQVLIGVVDRFAGILSPVAQALAPVFHQLAEVVGGVFLDVARALAESFAGLLPIVELLATTLGPVVQLLADVFTQLLQQLVGVFAPVLGALLPILQAIVTVLALTQQVIDLFTTAIQGAINLLLTPLLLFLEVISLLIIPLKVLSELMTILSAAMQTAGQILALAFLPVQLVLDQFNDALTSLHDVTRAVQIVFKSLYDAIAAWFRGFLKTFLDFSSVVDAVKKAFQEAAKAVILFSARLALFFGASDFVKALIKNLSAEGAEKGVVAAPQNVRIQDFASIAKDLVQASFAAGPGGEQKTERDYLREMVPLLQEMLKNPQDLKAEMIRGFHDVIEQLKKLLGDTFKPQNLRQQDQVDVGPVNFSLDRLLKRLGG